MYLRPMTASEVKQWYDRELTRAFPPDECKPLSEIAALMERGRYEALGLYAEDALLGYATLLWEPGLAGLCAAGLFGSHRRAPEQRTGLAGLVAQLRARCRDRAGDDHRGGGPGTRWRPGGERPALPEAGIL